MVDPKYSLMTKCQYDDPEIASLYVARDPH